MNAKNQVKDDENQIKSVIISHCIEQLIKKPTRFDFLTYRTSTLIDIIGTKNTSIILSSRVIQSSIDDHGILGCLSKMNCKRFVSRTILCREHSKYDPESLRRDIENSDINLKIH